MCHDIALGALISVCSAELQLNQKRLISTRRSIEEVYVYDVSSVQYLR